LNVRIVQETDQAFAIYLGGDADVASKPIYGERLRCTLATHQDVLTVNALLDDMAERIAWAETVKVFWRGACAA
jgi:hypothetical protein